jgi:hypothetical protein
MGRGCALEAFAVFRFYAEKPTPTTAKGSIRRVSEFLESDQFQRFRILFAIGNRRENELCQAEADPFKSGWVRLVAIDQGLHTFVQHAIHHRKRFWSKVLVPKGHNLLLQDTPNPT